MIMKSWRKEQWWHFTGISILLLSIGVPLQDFEQQSRADSQPSEHSNGRAATLVHNNNAEQEILTNQRDEFEAEISTMEIESLAQFISFVENNKSDLVNSDSLAILMGKAISSIPIELMNGASEGKISFFESYRPESLLLVEEGFKRDFDGTLRFVEDLPLGRTRTQYL